MSWPLGTLVREKGAEPTVHGLRVVIGHKPDGRVMTAYVSPPPWMTPAEQRRIFVGEATSLTPLEERPAPLAASAPRMAQPRLRRGHAWRGRAVRPRLPVFG